MPDTQTLMLIIAATVISDASTMLEIPTYATTRTAALSAARGLLTWLRLGFVIIGFQLLGTSLASYGASVVATSVASVILLGVLWWLLDSGRWTVGGATGPWLKRAT